MRKTQFFKKELIEIVEKASTITERLDTKFLLDESQANEIIVNSKIEQWSRVLAQGYRKQLEKRLAWDGLDLEKVYYSLSGSVHLNKDQKLPDWTETLYECLQAVTSVTLESLEEKISEQSRVLDPQEPIPFEEILLPFIDVARQKLIAQTESHYTLLSNNAHLSLERSLLSHLASLCGSSMELEFSIFRATRQSKMARILKESKNSDSKHYYQDFIQEMLSGKILAFFQEYPVLARLMATAIDFWVDANSELIYRLTSDWSEIQQTFQPEIELLQVTAIDPLLSDHHHNGRSVAAITFESGLKIMYKPKNLGLEKAYFQLLDWLNKQDIFLPFKLLKVIDRSTYGWVEFAEASPCQNEDELRRYYQRSGILLCLVYVLEGTDLHRENIIACGEHPVLIDHETLMHPRIRIIDGENTINSTRYIANQQIHNSVFRTGLLPQWEMGPGNQKYDASGLGGIGQQETFFRVPRWHNINNDMMVIGNENIKIQPKSNIPVPDQNSDELFLQEYFENIIDGFRKTYYFLIDKREVILAPDGPLTLLAHQPIRFVFRATQVYSSILKQSLNPKFLRDGIDRSIHFDILSRVGILSESKPLFWPLIKIEQDSLQQLDIPLFTANSDSDALVVSPTQTINNYFTEASFDSIVSRLNQLNNNDLEQQIFFIEGSLYSRVADKDHRFSLPKQGDSVFNAIMPLTQEEMIHQGIKIAENLKKRSICSANGGATWIAPQYISKAECFQLQPIGYSLYDGSYGIALFLAALEKVTHITRFRDLSLGAIQSIREDLKNLTLTGNDKGIVQNIDIGGATGLGSIIYVLVRISQFLDDQSLLDDAKQVASLISPDFITADNRFDIISGSAGAILGLLALYKTSADSEVLEKAITCGHHLLNHRVVSDAGHRTWATSNKTLLTGFSHGAAGIAYALLRLYQVTGEEAFREAALEAISYERSVFISEENNWPDFRELPAQNSPTCMCSWCHGAPGIGLARVAGLNILDTPEIRQDIEAAIKTTRKQKLLGVDHLCCGNLGLTEFLFTVGQKLSQPELIETAMNQAAQVLARAEQQEHFSYGLSLTFHPSFFQGASGIGYQLLRLAYPNQLPSVLLWE
jgi:type 2 lantibiotic biosynthesis protein LanM